MYNIHIYIYIYIFCIEYTQDLSSQRKTLVDYMYTPETNTAPEKQCFNVCFPCGMASFQGICFMFVSGV